MCYSLYLVWWVWLPMVSRLYSSCWPAVVTVLFSWNAFIFKLESIRSNNINAASPGPISSAAVFSFRCHATLSSSLWGSVAWRLRKRLRKRLALAMMICNFLVRLLDKPLSVETSLSLLRSFTSVKLAPSYSFPQKYQIPLRSLHKKVLKAMLWKPCTNDK